MESVVELADVWQIPWDPVTDTVPAGLRKTKYKLITMRPCCF